MSTVGILKGYVKQTQPLFEQTHTQTWYGSISTSCQAESVNGVVITWVGGNKWKCCPVGIILGTLCPVFPSSRTDLLLGSHSIRRITQKYMEVPRFLTGSWCVYIYHFTNNVSRAVLFWLMHWKDISRRLFHMCVHKSMGKVVLWTILCWCSVFANNKFSRAGNSLRKFVFSNSEGNFLVLFPRKVTYCPICFKSRSRLLLGLSFNSLWIDGFGSCPSTADSSLCLFRWSFD